MLNIYYGRENLDKENFIFDSLGDRALILVPDQFTLEMEREMFGRLKKQSLMDIEVISTTRLGYRLLSELGGSKRTFIDKYGRHMVLSEIAGRLGGELKIFRGLEKKSSFIDTVNNFISEMKQNNCGEKELREMAEQLSPEGADSYSRKKLEDLYLLYTEYEKRIAGRYTDSEDKIDLYIEKIRESELIKGNSIWVYGFDSYAPKFMSIIGELMSHAANVNVVLTGATDRKCRDLELFALTDVVMANLKREAEARGIPYNTAKIPDTYIVEEKNPALEHMERELYALPVKKYTGALLNADVQECRDKSLEDGCKAIDNRGKMSGSPAVTLVEAANLYNEAEDAAAYVLSLVREEGMRYSDIRVICNDNDVLGPIMKRTFREYGMDLFSDATRDILETPVPQYILSLLEVKTSSYRTQAVMKYLKSGFTDLTAEEIAELENYAIKYRVRGAMWKKPFIKGESEYGVDGLHELNVLREKAIASLVEFEENYKAKTNREFIENLYAFLYRKGGLSERVLSFIQTCEEADKIETAEETEQIWGEIISILDQINEISGDEKFKAQDFRNLLETGISEVEMGVLPPTKDGLIMGNMQRTRTGALKALVVVGANEGILPKEKAGGGLFTRDEKELFKNRGVELCQVDSVMLLEEKMAIYRNLSKPTEKLYMSCSSADIDGKAVRASSVFTRISEIFPDVEISRDILNRDDRRNLISNTVGGLRHLTEEVMKAAETGEVLPEWKEAVSWYNENRADSVADLKRGIAFENKTEKLGKQAVDALYRRDLESALSLSPSRIEKFARCPFSHLVNYGLKPEERRIYETASREIGDIYHECIMTFAQELTEKNVELTSPESRWMTVTEEETAARVKAIVEEKAENYREGVFRSGNEENYREKRIVDICTRACWTLIGQVRAGKILDSRFEVEFGRGKNISPVEIHLDGTEGETAYIEGKIDRVDYLPDDRVKIIDYKTGNEDFKTEEAKQGYRLQLMLYLKAAEERKRKPAGVFYFHISEPSQSAGNSRPDSEKLAAEIRKAFKMRGLIVNNEDVIRNVAGDFSGYSEIIPISNSKSSGITGGGDVLLSEEDFGALELAVSEKLNELVNELAEGDISIHPMKSRKSGSGAKNACKFCNYKGICMFDTAFAGNKWNLI